MTSMEKRTKRSRGTTRMDPISIRISEVVRLTGLSRTKVYALIAAGDLKAAKVGRATLVFVESLRAFIESNPHCKHGGDRRSRAFKSSKLKVCEPF